MVKIEKEDSYYNLKLLLKKVIKREKNKELKKLKIDFEDIIEYKKKTNDSTFLKNIKYHEGTYDVEKRKVMKYYLEKENYLEKEVKELTIPIFENLERLKTTKLINRDYEQEKKTFNSAMETIKHFYTTYGNNVLFPNVAYVFPPSSSENYFVLEDSILRLFDSNLLELKEEEKEFIRDAYKDMYKVTFGKDLSRIESEKKSNSVKRHKENQKKVAELLEKLFESEN